MESRLGRDSDPAAGHLLREKMELSSLLQERVTGALLRSRFLQLKDMDAPSALFFNLERSVAQRQEMACLQLPGSRITKKTKRHEGSYGGFLFQTLFCRALQLGG